MVQILPRFLLILSPFLAAGQTKYAGVIEDVDTRQKVPFAHLSFRNSSVGTASNSEGYFELTVESTVGFDSLLVSHVNYYTKKIGMSELAENRISSIFLQPRSTVLEEVEVTGRSPAEYLKSILENQKASIKTPFSSRYYYREIVQSNGAYSKYSDALLVGNFPADKEQTQVGIEGARVIDFPTEGDDVLDLISPLEVSKIIEFQHLNVLDRFFGDNINLYEFQMRADGTHSSLITYEIRPKIKPEKGTLLYYGWVTTEDDKIRHIKIQLDSLTKWQKSLLGFTASITAMRFDLDFKDVLGTPVLAQGIVDLTLNFSSKRFAQKNQFVSDFVTLETTQNTLAKIEKGQKLKTKSIYKNGTNITTRFWEGKNIPTRTRQDEQLLNKLTEESRVKKSK